MSRKVRAGRPERAQWRERARQAPGGTLEGALDLLEVSEPMLAQVEQLGA
jgi:hypothetical protein